MGVPHETWATAYERIMERTYGTLYDRLTSAALDQVARILPAPGRIIDFGAGCGRLTLPLARLGHRVTAVDPAASMLAELDRRRSTLLPEARERIRTVHARMQDYEGEAEHDLALCVFTVISYHLEEEDLRLALRRAAASLGRGGRLLLDIPRAELFEGFEHDDAEMIRRVEIEPLGNGRHAYSEDTLLRDGNDVARYRDRFVIRRWHRHEVEALLSEAGFVTEADVAAAFTGLGATYLLMRRS